MSYNIRTEMLIYIWFASQCFLASGSLASTWCESSLLFTRWNLFVCLKLKC